MLPFVPLEDPREREDDDRGGRSGQPGGHDPTQDLTSAALGTLEASRVAYRERDRSEAVARVEETTERESIATLGDLQIARISRDEAVIGFHEANGHSTLSVEPTGPIHENHNPATSGVAPDADAPVEPRSMVLPSRDRGSGPHSAIDVAMPVGSEVFAPVTGTIVNAAPYTLYDQHPDTRIEIVPDDRPDIVVIMLHVTGAQVAPGDRVVAGQTVVADGPTPLPFRSQIDRFAEAAVGQPLPHVHIEIKRIA